MLIKSSINIDGAKRKYHNKSNAFSRSYREKWAFKCKFNVVLFWWWPKIWSRIYYTLFLQSTKHSSLNDWFHLSRSAFVQPKNRCDKDRNRKRKVCLRVNHDIQRKWEWQIIDTYSCLFLSSEIVFMSEIWVSPAFGSIDIPISRVLLILLPHCYLCTF